MSHNQVATFLERTAEGVSAPHLLGGVLARARRRRRRNAGGALISTAAVVATVVLITLPGGRNGQQSLLPAGPSPTTVPTTAPAVNNSTPSTPIAPTAQELSVADTPDGSTGGGVAPDEPQCLARHISAASATLSPAVDEVLGLVHLTSTACTYAGVDPVVVLLNSSRVPIAVPASSGDTTNPSGVDSAGALYQGRLTLGFAWTGSFCGPAPRFVQVTLAPAVSGSAARVIDVPLTGTPPRCTGHSDSQIIAGLPNGVGGVEPPPLRWETLTARLVLPRTVPDGPISASVVLTTSGSTPVALYGPCPNYGISESTPLANGELEMTGGEGGSLCAQNLVVRPHHALVIPLPPLTSNLDSQWKVGGDFTATWSIAGVPIAEATAIIR